MLQCGAGLIGLLLPCAAIAQVPVTLHATYKTYSAGIQVAAVETGFSSGPWNYQMDLGFHTIGMAGLLFNGQQFDQVNGAWNGRQAVPSRFAGRGLWRGAERLTEIDYRQGKPLIRQLLPSDAEEREPVPDPLQANSIDTLSALAQLIHVVTATGRCETKVHTYDGRRAIEIEAHTVGEEVLEPTSRSSFAGKTLRCDFSGRLLAGFKLGDDRVRDGKPMHGSAWLAPVLADGQPLPVRMAFETRWVGEATMYLTGIAPAADGKVTRGN